MARRDCRDDGVNPSRRAVARVPAVEVQATTQDPAGTGADTVVVGVFEDDGDADGPDRGVQRLLLSAHHGISEPVRVAAIVVAAQNRARDLGNTPSNDLSPADLAEYAAQAAGRLGVRATVLEEDEIRSMGMGA